MSDPTEQQPVSAFANQGTQPTPQEFAKMQQAYLANKLKNQIISVFNTPEGMQLLDTLMEGFVHKPTWVPGAPEGYGYKREGENSLILYFKGIAERAQQPSQVAQ